MNMAASLFYKDLLQYAFNSVSVNAFNSASYFEAEVLHTKLADLQAHKCVDSAVHQSLNHPFRILVWRINTYSTPLTWLVTVNTYFFLPLSRYGFQVSGSRSSGLQVSRAAIGSRYTSIGMYMGLMGYSFRWVWLKTGGSPNTFEFLGGTEALHTKLAYLQTHKWVDSASKLKSGLSQSNMYLPCWIKAYLNIIPGTGSRFPGFKVVWSPGVQCS